MLQSCSTRSIEITSIPEQWSQSRSSHIDQCGQWPGWKAQCLQSLRGWKASEYHEVNQKLPGQEIAIQPRAPSIQKNCSGSEHHEKRHCKNPGSSFQSVLISSVMLCQRCSHCVGYHKQGDPATKSLDPKQMTWTRKHLPYQPSFNKFRFSLTSMSSRKRDLPSNPSEFAICIRCSLEVRVC